MLSASSTETILLMIQQNPPPPNVAYSEKVIVSFNKAKKNLEDAGHDISHIPDYIFVKKRSRASSSSAMPPSPPPVVPSVIPPSFSSSSSSSEDRILAALQWSHEYTQRCLSQIHEENAYLSKMMTQQFKYLNFFNSVESNAEFPPSPVQGFPFSWPPPEFPAPSHNEEAGPSGTGGDTSGAGGDGDGGDDGEHMET